MNFPILGNCDVYVTYIYMVYYSNLIIFIIYLYLIIRVSNRILFEMSLCICILVRRVNENSYFSWRNSLIVAGSIVWFLPLFKFSQLRGQVDSLNREIRTLKREVQGLNQQNRSLNSELQQLREQVSEHQNRLRTLEVYLPYMLLLL